MTYHHVEGGEYIAAEDYERLVDEWIINRAVSGDTSEAFTDYLARRRMESAGRLMDWNAA